MTQIPEDTKYKIGDWVRYIGQIYKIIDIQEIDSGFTYVLKEGNISMVVFMSVGDERFIKV